MTFLRILPPPSTKGVRVVLNQRVAVSDLLIDSHGVEITGRGGLEIDLHSQTKDSDSRVGAEV